MPEFEADLYNIIGRKTIDMDGILHLKHPLKFILHFLNIF